MCIFKVLVLVAMPWSIRYLSSDISLTNMQPISFTIIHQTCRRDHVIRKSPVLSGTVFQCPLTNVRNSSPPVCTSTICVFNKINNHRCLLFLSSLYIWKHWPIIYVETHLSSSEQTRLIYFTRWITNRYSRAVPV